MWNEIKSEKDLKSFMDTVCGFHDSCIKEIKYISGAYVDETLSMLPINTQRTLSVIIQRQFENPSVVEMQFVGLKYLRLFPIDEDYTCEILDTTMILKKDCIYWCDCGGLSATDIENYTGTAICASKVRWRAADEYIGSDEIYAAIQPAGVSPSLRRYTERYRTFCPNSRWLPIISLIPASTAYLQQDGHAAVLFYIVGSMPIHTSLSTP